jgi:putative ABC transport system permease protein
MLPAREQLPELQCAIDELVLLAIASLDAAGACETRIRAALEQATDRPVSAGALDAALAQLEQQALVRVWQVEAPSEAGGTATRYFSVEPAGRIALAAAEQARSRLRRPGGSTGLSLVGFPAPTFHADADVASNGRPQRLDPPGSGLAAPPLQREGGTHQGASLSRAPGLQRRHLNTRQRGLTVLAVLAVALHSLGRHKARSVLAMLGIIIGVGSVIATLALGEGTARAVQERIRRLGANVLSVRPGEQRDRAVRVNRALRRSLKLADLAAVQHGAPAVRLASPRVRGELRVQYRGENQETDVEGVGPEFFTIRNFPARRGRLFSAIEVENRARVGVLGAEIAEELFKEEDPLDQRLLVRGQPYRVLGILQERGGDDDFDDTLWIPVTTAMDRLYNLDYIHRLELQAVDQASMTAAEQQVTEVLRRRHHLRAGQDDDFIIRSQLDILETASETSQTFTYLLAGIACISLLVGGIGIMNIMLVSVVERTREIGIRRAVGARQGDILAQFLTEAVVMCGFGAILGVAAGVVGSWAGESYAAWPMFLTLPSILLSCTTAIVIGLTFGIYPAARAARLSPIDALRHE